MSPHWDTWEFNLSPVEIPHCDTWEFEFSAGEAEAEAAEAEILAPDAQPKQRPKPSNSTGIAREVMSRSPDDRKRFRELAASMGQSEEDSRELPWDIRGPLGPKDGGPQTWKDEKFDMAEQTENDAAARGLFQPGGGRRRSVSCPADLSPQGTERFRKNLMAIGRRRPRKKVSWRRGKRRSRACE